jgi:hypothetical protein
VPPQLYVGLFPQLGWWREGSLCGVLMPNYHITLEQGNALRKRYGMKLLGPDYDHPVASRLSTRS